MTDDDLGTIPPSRGGPPAGTGIRLLHLQGSLSGTSFPIAAGAVTLGRRSGIEVAFDRQTDFLVSGLHARIHQADDRSWHIEDVGSTNGTFVNGSRLQGRQRLRSGDVVILGSATEANGAAVFRVDVEGEAAPPAQKPPASPSVSPFRAPPMPAAPPGVPTGLSPDPQSPARPHPMQHPMQGQGRPPTPPEEAGFLGFNRLKGAIMRFMDRREVQRRIDTDRRKLPELREAADRSCRALGLQLHRDWPTGGSQLTTRTRLQAFERELETMIDERKRARDRCDAVRATFEADKQSWRAAHEKLEATAAGCAREATQLAGDRDAAAAAVTSALALKFTALAEVRDAIVAFLDKHVDPEPGFAHEALPLGSQLREVAVRCEEPIAGLAELFARREELRQRAEQARAASAEADAEVMKSNAAHATEADHLAALEQELRRTESSFEQRVRDLENRHASAFAAFGAEAALVDDRGIQALGAQPAAAMAMRELREIEQRIADAEATLAELGG
jgi:pSer/pThr/pTyr-binding forkhead associated (FHA) protein